MRTIPARLAVVLSLPLVFLLPESLLAHHSRAGFDLENSSRLEGVITKFRWGNPHIYISVQTDDGDVWLIEGHSVPGASPLGWNKDMFKEGDRVQLAANLATDPDKKFALLDWIVTADGTPLRGFRGSEIPAEFMAGSAPAGQDAQEEQEEAGPSVDFGGYWEIVRRGGFQRRTTIPGPTTGLPLTALGEKQIESYDAEKNPNFECIQPGFPQLLQGTRAYGLRFVRFEDRIEMTKDHANVTWTVWIDEGAAPNDPPRAPTGHSVGQLEDDNTLVFETTNFAAVPWGTGRGVDSSEEKHVSTRMVLADDGMSIDYTATISDPVYLTEPLVQEGHLQVRPKGAFGEDPPCDPANSSMHLTLDR